MEAEQIITEIVCTPMTDWLAETAHERQASSHRPKQKEGEFFA